MHLSTSAHLMKGSALLS
jgi:hypothetical protein